MRALLLLALATCTIAPKENIDEAGDSPHLEGICRPLATGGGITLSRCAMSDATCYIFGENISCVRALGSEQ